MTDKPQRQGTPPGPGQEKPKKDYIKELLAHSFFTYTWIGAIFTLLNIFFLWLFIDVFGIPTIAASAIVVGGLFVLKYLSYKITGLFGKSFHE
jgi:hypothetical protein